MRGRIPVPDSCCNTTLVGQDFARCQKLYDNGQNASYIYIDVSRNNHDLLHLFSIDLIYIIYALHDIQMLIKA